MKYAIVIPARNEQARLRSTVEEYVAYGERNLGVEGWEIVLVVNGSVDGTGSIARALEGSFGPVRMVETPRRLGKGGAVLLGFDLSEAAIVSFVDADNSTRPGELHKLLQAVDRGAAAAIGSRWLPASRQVVAQPWPRRLASRIFNRLVRRLFELPFSDTQCGAKAFDGAAFQHVRPSLEAFGWAFDVEILVRLRREGYRIEEVPIEWRDSSGSRLRMHRDGPSVLWELTRLRRRLRDG